MGDAGDARLQVPVVFWPETPFTHEIECGTFLKPRPGGERTAVTGDKLGRLCLWKVSFDPLDPVRSLLKPVALLVGHKANVSAIVSLSESRFISVCSQGSVALWRSKDGKCLAFKGKLLHELVPNSMTVLDETHVLVAGNNQFSFIVGTLGDSLRVVKRVKMAQDWIRVLDSNNMKESDGNPIAIAISKDGAVRFCGLKVPQYYPEVSPQGGAPSDALMSPMRGPSSRGVPQSPRTPLVSHSTVNLQLQSPGPSTPLKSGSVTPQSRKAMSSSSMSAQGGPGSPYKTPTSSRPPPALRAFGDSHDSGNILPLQQVQLQPNIHTIAVCPQGLTFVSVSSEEWAVFSGAYTRVICPSPPPPPAAQEEGSSFHPKEVSTPTFGSQCFGLNVKGWSACEYVDCFRFVLWSSDGDAFLFLLPNTNLTKAFQFSERLIVPPPCVFLTFPPPSSSMIKHPNKKKKKKTS